jgi:hypothetical protein
MCSFLSRSQLGLPLFRDQQPLREETLRPVSGRIPDAVSDGRTAAHKYGFETESARDVLWTRWPGSARSLVSIVPCSKSSESKNIHSTTSSGCGSSVRAR